MERQAHYDCYNEVVNYSVLSQEASFKYWPDKNHNVEYDTFDVETTSEESLGDSIIKRVMKMTHVETVRILLMYL